MRSVRTTFLKVALSLTSAAAFLPADAADPAPAGAPEKIEFSRSSSTTPKVPRPGIKNEDRLKDIGNVPELAAPQPNISIPMQPGTATMPSKATAEKMMREWDRKKNWAFDDGKKSEDPFARTDTKELDAFSETEKPKGLMEEFILGDGDSKRNTSGQYRLRDRDTDKNRRDNPLLDSKDRNDKRDEKDDKDLRDPDDNRDSNGLAEFNLKNFIRQQNMPTFLKDNQLPKAAQLFRSEIGGNPNTAVDQRQFDRDRAQRDARAAEFNQLIKPRNSGAAGFAGINDPVNAPDLSRRELNPVTPRTLEPGSLSRSPFSSGTPSPASRIQENNMLGVTGPAAASSIAPVVTAPPPRVDATRSHQVIIEAPRRIGF